MARITRILLECTSTFENDINTGIQRVVRNIVQESRQFANDCSLDIVPVISKYGRFWKMEEKQNRFIYYKTLCLAKLKKLYGKIRPAIMKLSPAGTLEKWIFASVGYVSTSLLNAIFWPFTITAYYKRRIVIHKNDMVLLLDSSWIYPIWPAVRYAKERGATVGLVVYDIIQITHHQYFCGAITDRFANWFNTAIHEVDFCVAISQTVQKEIQKYVAAKYPSHKLIEKNNFFVLGSAMDKIAVKTDVREEVNEAFNGNNDSGIYLVVGTIEPRKNYGYLLDVFERVWKEFPSSRLCIVGRTGWQCEDFVQKFKSHPLYAKSLYMFNDLSDAELDYCYSHAKSLIFPSHAEGFGLPIVEALFKGLPVLASDIPIFREIGKDFCTYFDQTNPASLANIICKIEKDGKMPPVCQPEQYHLASWADSCRELLTKSLELSRN